MTKKVHTFCRICEPACPLTASVDENENITSLEPNMEHPTKGVACHKGLSYPLRRVLQIRLQRGDVFIFIDTSR
jgi:anaerobic selenocysteine-containing dehydrogenase